MTDTPALPLKHKDRCPSQCVMDDERFPITQRCELPIGHGGLHQHVMNACEPLAWLIWREAV